MNTSITVVFATEDRWHVVVEREVEHDVGDAVISVGGDRANFPPIRQVIKESRVLFLPNAITNQNRITTNDLIGNTWAIPSRNIADFDAIGSDAANVAVVDTYSFNEAGTTSDSETGGPTYNWQITENNTIELQVPNRE